jgi:hypothetical protein
MLCIKMNEIIGLIDVENIKYVKMQAKIINCQYLFQ